MVPLKPTPIRPTFNLSFALELTMPNDMEGNIVVAPAMIEVFRINLRLEYMVI